MPVRETIIPGTIRYQRCARCGKELGEIHNLFDYDPGALCRDHKAEKAREDDLAEARLEGMDFYDRELKKYLSDNLKDTIWNEACKKFHIPEEEQA